MTIMPETTNQVNPSALAAHGYLCARHGVDLDSIEFRSHEDFVAAVAEHEATHDDENVKRKRALLLFVDPTIDAIGAPELLAEYPSAPRWALTPPDKWDSQDHKGEVLCRTWERIVFEDEAQRYSVRLNRDDTGLLAGDGLVLQHGPDAINIDASEFVGLTASDARAIAVALISAAEILDAAAAVDEAVHEAVHE